MKGYQISVFSPEVLFVVLDAGEVDQLSESQVFFEIFRFLSKFGHRLTRQRIIRRHAFPRHPLLELLQAKNEHFAFANQFGQQEFILHFPHEKKLVEQFLVERVSHIHFARERIQFDAGGRQDSRSRVLSREKIGLTDEYKA